jgi:hypothetical protein
MEEIESIFPALTGHLTGEDDYDLWRLISLTVGDDFFQHHKKRGTKGQAWYLRLGCCSHWVRPHQSRWTAAGGFAWPAGYKGAAGHSLVEGLPEFDWSEVFRFESGRWMHVQKFSGKKQIVLRVAVPARTTRHMQAAVHSIWSDTNDVVFYGFRKLTGEWKCVAATDHQEKGRVSIGVLPPK